ncbi:hypothetical protein EJ110_NYTH49038 [Nymphaea thermarum]|nr:hypothetical protein EJ110_NYTH49038 [Nymphaea thermarum]
MNVDDEIIVNEELNVDEEIVKGTTLSNMLKKTQIIRVAFGWAYCYKKASTNISVKAMGLLQRALEGSLSKIGRRRPTILMMKPEGADQGVLEDKGVVAAKKHEDWSQGSEAQFWSEISTIGFLYCDVKGLLYKQTPIQYPLTATTLSHLPGFLHKLNHLRSKPQLSNSQEWVHHYHVKPQNVLLDNDFLPKVPDFLVCPSFLTEVEITSKFYKIGAQEVDVYNYGILVLELVIGLNSTGSPQIGENGEVGYRQLIPWIRDMVRRNRKWVEETTDPQVSGMYNSSVEILIKVEEERDGRSTMSHVVDAVTVAWPSPIILNHSLRVLRSPIRIFWSLHTLWAIFIQRV